MISPEELQRKAQNLYPDFLRAWLAGEAFFPRSIPANRDLDDNDHAGAIAAIDALRQQSKEIRGFGYSIEWRERRSRAFGRNRFPERFYFETQDDYLRFIKKQAEFAAFATAVERMRREFPELENWIASHRQTLIEIEPLLEGLLQVLAHLRANPRPDCFGRELPVPVDSKFIERHQRVLRDWLDIVLPPNAIRSDETHFYRRFGLRYPELHIMIRFLDPALQDELQSPWQELSLPLSALAALRVHEIKVIIVENKVSLLTLPKRPRTIGLGALGYAVSELRSVRWLHTVPIVYWGDIDVEGFEILSALRAAFPQVQSMLMDGATVAAQRRFAVPGVGRHPGAPPHLTPSELVAFSCCVNENIRIEQERLSAYDAGAAQ